MIPAWFERDLTDGIAGADVRIVQRKVKAPVTGVYDVSTAAAVRGFQLVHGLEGDGVVGAKTAAKLGNKQSAGIPPGWFVRDLSDGASGLDVAQLRLCLRQPNLPDYFDTALGVEVRRFQASVGIRPTGVCDRVTAVALAAREF